jgi:hypothetical protein
MTIRTVLPPMVWCLALALPRPALARAAGHAQAEMDCWGRVVRNADGSARVYQEADLPPCAPGAQGQTTIGPTPALEGATGALNYDLRWQYSVFGTGIGDTGLQAVDLAGDGQMRVVAAASSKLNSWPNDFWYVVGYVAGPTPGYEQIWASTPYPAGIRSLRTAQLDGDPALEVLVGTGSKILVYDGVTHRLQRTIDTTAAEVRGLTVADVDSDGQLELVFCSGTAVYVYDATTGAQEYVGAGYGGFDLAVGNVDDDPGLEIVVGNDAQTGYVLGGQSHAVEWANPWGFGRYVSLGDLDGDGKAEVVSGYSWYQIRIFDVDLHSLTDSISATLDIDSVRVADVEGDGPLEIVYGDGQLGDVHVHNGQDRTLKWSISTSDYGVTDLAFGDTDGDGVREILWGGGYGSTGPDHLYVASAATHVVEWRSADIDGPFLALSTGEPDGRRVVLSGSYESDAGYGDGLYFYHDAATGHVLYQSPPPTGGNYTGLWRIRSANVDADPQDEVFITTSNGYTGLIICYDGQSHQEQWQVSIPDGLTFGSMDLADADNDGALEVVAGVNVEHTGAPGVYVYVFNAATGALKWRSPSLSAGFVNLPLLRVANLDGDPQPEIIVGATDGAVYVLDAVLQTTLHLGFHGVTALDTPDRDADGRAEIVIGTSAGYVRVLDPVTGFVLEDVLKAPPRIDGLAVADLDEDGRADYVLAVSNAVQVRDGDSLALAWSSGVLGLGTGINAVGASDSLSLARVDATEPLDILVSIGTSGFKVFRRVP